MKKKNIIIIVAVLVVGLVATIVALRGSRKSTFKQDYHVADIASVTRVFMADKEGTHVMLERPAAGSADTTWIVDGQYPANQHLVDLMLETLHDMRIRQQVNRNAVPNIIARISSSSVKVEVYQKRYAIDWFKHHLRLFPAEKLAVTYFVGNETQDLMGSFVFREGDKVPYIIHIPGFRGYITPRFFADPTQWRSHKIIDLDINHIAEVKLDIPASPDESFTVKRNGDGFSFVAADGQVVPFDTARVAQLLSGFTNLNFDEYAQIVPNSNTDSSFVGGPRTVLRITDTDGNSREMKTYIKYVNTDDLQAMPDPEMYETFDLNRLYAIIDNSDTVLIQYYAFDNILQPASYFRGQTKTAIAK
ncbi:MAG: DUF4340 domain-containing protein [Bacteroidales bacterium]|nr:DUF4340 domain-containing protein [Bacteroidales bacterium]